MPLIKLPVFIPTPVFDIKRDPNQPNRETTINNIRTALRNGDIKSLLLAISHAYRHNIDHAELINDYRYTFTPYKGADFKLANALYKDDNSLFSICLGVKNGLGK